MRLFFGLLSAAYIFLIFFLANSPVVQHVSVFNPYSLLHIPLYGLLSFLLFCSLQNPLNSLKRKTWLLTALIAGVVSVLDEINQSLLPNREGSLGDVLLDLSGILLVLLIIKRFFPLRQNCLLRKEEKSVIE